MDKETNEIIYDSKSMEAVAVRIDMLKANKRFDEAKDE